MEKPEFRHDEKRDLFIGQFDHHDVYYRGFYSNSKNKHLNGFVYRNFDSNNSDYEGDEYNSNGHLSTPGDRFTKYSDVSTKNVKTYYFRTDNPNFLSRAKKTAIDRGIIIKSQIKSLDENETLEEKYNIITLQFELLEEDKKLYRKIKFNNTIVNITSQSLGFIILFGSIGLFIFISMYIVLWIFDLL
ncbi:MAG TPA: hypothetical protein VFM72_07100 [Aequorivita sp.]|nr:hypothetical protein [Aequorivita sp.]